MVFFTGEYKSELLMDQFTMGVAQTFWNYLQRIKLSFHSMSQLPVIFLRGCSSIER